MRKFLLVIVLTALASCSNGGSDGRHPSGLQAANAAYDRALINGDRQALDSLYTDDFRIIDDHANVRNKQDQIRFMTETVDLIDARSDDVQVASLGRDAALLTGRFTGRYRMDGRENSFTERYSSVWVREDGEWKIKHEHSSLIPETPEPAAT